MSNLLTKCNADVFKAILHIKSIEPETGENLLALLQKHKYWWQMPMGDVMWFSAYLPWEIWDRKVHTLTCLFESKQTTEMP